MVTIATEEEGTLLLSKHNIFLGSSNYSNRWMLNGNYRNRYNVVTVET